MAKGKSRGRKTKDAKKKEKEQVEQGESGAAEEKQSSSPRQTEYNDYDFEEPTVEWIPPPDQVQNFEDVPIDSIVPIENAITLRNTNNCVPSNTCVFDYTKAEFVEEPPMQFQEIRVHFDLTGKKAHTQSQAAEIHRAWLQDEADMRRAEAENAAGEAGGEGVSRTVEVAKNQFNYSDRAAQTFNNPHKRRSVATKPPELRTISDTCTSWKVHDHYVAKFLESEQVKASAGNKKSKGAKTEPTKKSKKEEDIVHCDDMSKTLKILERIVNQNADHEIYMDYKYWEDQSDQFREGEGSLLPLWRFSHELTKRKQVTAICWNPSLPDLFAVGYGSYDFMRQGGGKVYCYSLKNTSTPEYKFDTESGVMSLDFHPLGAFGALLAVGCYDGTVMVFDVRNKVNKPIYVSTIKTGKHTDPVWDVKWQDDDIAKQLGFMSISSDGRVANWLMSKNSLIMETAMSLKLVNSEQGEMGDEDVGLSGLASGCCFDFNKASEHLYLVGTEEGKIHKCSKAYSGQYLETYNGHHMAVYAVKWNPYHPRVFLSCSADWTVKLWDHSCSDPIMSFDLGNAVGDVAWSPYSSTVFAAVTSDGKVHVFDIKENKHEPICEQKVVKRAKLTHVAFNAKSPLLLVGDDRGGVNSLKLSPNLRKLWTPSGPSIDNQEQIQRLESLLDVTEVSAK